MQAVLPHKAMLYKLETLSDALIANYGYWYLFLKSQINMKINIKITAATPNDVESGTGLWTVPELLDYVNLQDVAGGMEAKHPLDWSPTKEPWVKILGTWLTRLHF